MKLFIPELGTKLKLTKNWNFFLEAERRNLTLFQNRKSKSVVNEKRKELKEKLNLLKDKIRSELSIKNSYCWNDSIHFQEYDRTREEYWNTLGRKVIRDFKGKIYSIPKNTILEIDRIYIRKGAKDFSSITFKWNKDNRIIRFWANLNEVNKIECKLLPK